MINRNQATTVLLRILAVAFSVGALAVLASCGEKAPQLPRLGPGDVVLAFGDSITYGTGASAEEAYPSVLSNLLSRQVVGAGVPRETTADGLERLPAVLDDVKPRLMLLCMGGNDMLRKGDASLTESNLRSMVRIAAERGVAVVLIGVPEPVLFGTTAAFYGAIAKDYHLPFENKILEELLFDGQLKSDPIHPNARGYRRLAEAMAELLRKAGAV